ncbi:hypothetical protein [Methyloceanibacter sp. wino2]|uniref:hypothetical protein n=1 Tax=Methyloceanibacter sp. wino2 TaxID=2170729 RepID=UPI00131F08C1|nr:hypothetical protein [Methyloceanibacter sp. wino2]
MQAVERYWTRLTEQDLLATEFTTNNPTELAGLVEERPETEEIPIVEMLYDLRGTDKKVRCVHDRYDNHQRGIVMRYRDGRRILVGRDCARKIWGVNFDLLIKDFDLAKDTAYYLRRRNAARDAGPNFLASLAELRQAPAIGLYQNLKSDFRRRLPGLASDIDDLIYERDGMLFRDERVRDLMAEQRRAEKANEEGPPIRTQAAKRYLQAMGGQKDEPKKQLNPIYTTIQTQLGMLEGQDFFGGGTEPIGLRVSEYEKRAISGLRQLGDDHEYLEMLRNRLKGLTEIVDGVIGEIDRLDALSAAFAPHNLSWLAQWANSISKDGTRYRTEQGTFIAAPDRDDDILLRFPSNYRVPSREPFMAFREAVTG